MTNQQAQSDRSAHAVDAGRLRRALARRVKRIRPDVYLVEGRAEPQYLVDLNEATPCTCYDARAHGPCLHTLAARLHAGDGALIVMTNELLTAAETELRTMRVRARRNVERSR